LIEAEALCSGRGERLNRAGREVLKVLLQSTRPLKAYDLTYALGDAGRSAAPPTVYRALRLLIGVGLVHRIETLNAFVACRFPGEHHLPGFVVCEVCGVADEVRLEALPPQIAVSEHDRLVLEISRCCAVCVSTNGR
jgi:Fur family zinc uptake transcriptional regulator